MTYNPDEAVLAGKLRSEEKDDIVGLSTVQFVTASGGYVTIEKVLERLE